MHHWCLQEVEKQKYNLGDGRRSQLLYDGVCTRAHVCVQWECEPGAAGQNVRDKSAAFEGKLEAEERK